MGPGCRAGAAAPGAARPPRLAPPGRCFRLASRRRARRLNHRVIDRAGKEPGPAWAEIEPAAAAFDPARPGICRLAAHPTPPAPPPTPQCSHPPCHSAQHGRRPPPPDPTQAGPGSAAIHAVTPAHKRPAAAAAAATAATSTTIFGV
jgi:hypothetical protein